MRHADDQLENAIVSLLLTHDHMNLEEVESRLTRNLGPSALKQARDALDALLDRGVVTMRLRPRNQNGGGSGCELLLTPTEDPRPALES